MSYSCSRHQWYSPVQPCMSCARERDMQMMGMAQQSANQEAMMRAQMQAQRWPQDVFERLEGERDVAVKLAATYRVALEKIASGVPGCDAEYIAREALGSPSGSEGSDG